jgi:DNA-binding transcriptional LysR family regulator
MNGHEPDWSLYRSFLAVLTEGSLSGAARALGLTQPTLARHIDALEQAVGLELFVRSQAGLSPTDGALALKPYAEDLARTAAAMLRAASGHGTAVAGTVRVTASETIGAEVLPPLFARLCERHPGLEIELVLANTVDNLLRREADIAVRMIEPAQEALVVRRVGTVTLGFYAHTRYLDRAGRPRTLHDLKQHSVIGFDRETPETRSLRRRIAGSHDVGGALDDIRFSFRTDDGHAQLMAIRAGVGIGICQTALARRSGDLERVLPKAFAFKLDVFLVMHEDLRSTPRCRAVFDGLAAGLKSHVD